MQNKIELLAPAGDWDAFLAAVENGADAVYLGGKTFNARQLAGNFDEQQLKSAVYYAHIRGVSVYLTMNTLIADTELPQAVKSLEYAYLAGIDGIIVQDMGFARIIRNYLPDLSLHASTQMTVYNLEGVKAMEKLGFKRVVLSRELTIDEIEFIAKSCIAEIEIFIHGALCISYSGQCLMSSIIGRRSGNRGKCAQPCRLPYTLLEKKPLSTEIVNELHLKKDEKYLLSPKDLCLVDKLPCIVGSGVKSFKIEGRMKNAEYVATVVRIYRKQLDDILSMPEGSRREAHIGTEDAKDLLRIFNRGGFSNGYFAGKQGKDMMCYEKPKNRGIFLGEVIAYDRTARTVKVRLQDRLSIGDGVEVWSSNEENVGALITQIIDDGKNAGTSHVGSIVSMGSLNGAILKGDRVYKTFDTVLNALARETYSGKFYRKVKLKGRIRIKNSEPICLNISDDIGNSVEVSSGHAPQGAVNRPLTDQRLLEQINKTGSTPYEFTEIKAELDENLSVSISVINDIRRKALDEMDRKRACRYVRKLSDNLIENVNNHLYFPGNSQNKSKRVEGVKGKAYISIYLHKWHNGLDCMDLSADRLYLPFYSLFDVKAQKAVDTYIEKGMEVYAWLPQITKGNYDYLIKSKLRAAVKAGISGLLIGNLGSIEYAAGFPYLKIIGDYSLNVYNSSSIEMLSAMGLDGITLSLELTLNQINRLERTPGVDREAAVYGRIPIMTSEYCPAGSIAGGLGAGLKCKEVCKNGSFALKDRMGMEFPVLCDRIDCRSTLLNSNVLFVPDDLDRIISSGVDILRLYVTDEPADEIEEIVNLYRDIAAFGTSAMKDYRGIIERIKTRGFTKGHFFRGV